MLGFELLGRYRTPPPPRPPFCLNRDHPRARGLVAWMPWGFPLQTSAINQSFRSERFTGYQEGSPPTEGPVLWTIDPVMGVVPGTFGDGSHFRIAKNLHTGKPFSAMAWFRMDSTELLGRCAVGWADTGSTNDWDILMVDDTPQLIAASRNAGSAQAEAIVTSKNVTVGAWHHGVAIFRADAEREAVLDGVHASGAETTNKPSVTTNVSIPGYQSAFNAHQRKWDGAIGEVCIYDREVDFWECEQAWNPLTRWDLRYPLGRRTYFFVAAAGGGNAMPMAQDSYHRRRSA